MCDGVVGGLWLDAEGPPREPGGQQGLHHQVPHQPQPVPRQRLAPRPDDGMRTSVIILLLLLIISTILLLLLFLLLLLLIIIIIILLLLLLFLVLLLIILLPTCRRW
jgi:Flp pilus assembly protein TadB